MNKLKIITLAAAMSLALPTIAEAGPIRNLVKRVCGKGKAVASKVVKAPAAAVRGGCAGGRCAR